MAYYEVTMTVPQDGTLAMGLSCEIRVLYQSVKNVTTVSIDAIQYDSDGKPFVYCYDRKDEIVRQKVTLLTPSEAQLKLDGAEALHNGALETRSEAEQVMLLYHNRRRPQPGGLWNKLLQ